MKEKQFTIPYFSYICVILVVTMWMNPFPLCAQRRYQSYLDYIEKYKEEAVEQMERYRIPASITLAQGLLESGAGQSVLARKSNNHFGIKCGSTWTGRRSYHDDDARGECFRAYKHVTDSYEDHSRFLASNQRYASLFRLKTTDYKGWAHGLKKAGYATSPTYATKLINLIELYELDRFDNGKLKGGSFINPHQVFLANKLIYVVARSGDTFESLSEEFDISAKKLREYNDLYKGYVLKVGDIVYLEKKNRRACKPYTIHRVETGESMYTISQRYGIRLKKLYKLNDKKSDYAPRVGEFLKLR